MAGSINLVVYTSDFVAGSGGSGSGSGSGSGTGQQYKMMLDESNSLALGFVDASTPAHAALPEFPGRWEMRTINATHIPSTAGAAPIKRTFPVGVATQANFRSGGTFNMPLYPGGTDVAWVVTAANGEKRRFSGLEDTGITDGTAS